MVLATKPEASSNFQATMADCSYLDSDSASERPPKRKSLNNLQKQHRQRSLTLFQMLKQNLTIYNTESLVQQQPTHLIAKRG